MSSESRSCSGRVHVEVVQLLRQAGPSLSRQQGWASCVQFIARVRTRVYRYRHTCIAIRTRVPGTNSGTGIAIHGTCTRPWTCILERMFIMDGPYWYLVCHISKCPFSSISRVGIIAILQLLYVVWPYLLYSRYLLE